MREIGAGLAVCVAMTLAVFLIAARPLPGRPVVALFASGSSAAAMAAVVAQAGGSLIRIDTASATVVTIAEDPHFAAALYAGGARLVVNGSLAPLCSLAGRGAA